MPTRGGRQSTFSCPNQTKTHSLREKTPSGAEIYPGGVLLIEQDPRSLKLQQDHSNPPAGLAK